MVHGFSKYSSKQTATNVILTVVLVLMTQMYSGLAPNNRAYRKKSARGEGGVELGFEPCVKPALGPSNDLIIRTKPICKDRSSSP